MIESVLPLLCSFSLNCRSASPKNVIGGANERALGFQVVATPVSSQNCVFRASKFKELRKASLDVFREWAEIEGVSPGYFCRRSSLPGLLDFGESPPNLSSGRNDRWLIFIATKAIYKQNVRCRRRLGV
jgi:hypothetical protein